VTVITLPSSSEENEPGDFPADRQPVRVASQPETDE
jgi:hypothetical protein